MHTENFFPKAYEPLTVQDRLYKQWLEQKIFHANAHSSKPSFSIVMPPPNITGVLTLGHVLNNTIQDILSRKARMEGKEVLWLPGLDHAGLATQVAVQKYLLKTKKIDPQTLSKEEFLKIVWEWKENHSQKILEQLQKLGCSADWQRTRFTLDAAYSQAVANAFIRLYQKGLIYRGKRMINWCPASQTALSDEEVIPKKIDGVLFFVRYRLFDDPSVSLTVATTRPETIPADSALAVHPDDSRYKQFIGKFCLRPFPKEPIPIIADRRVDPQFGTGVLKITPAHDKLDFEIGTEHNLPIRDILTAEAKLNCPEVVELHGLDRFEARKKAAELLSSLGLLESEQPYSHVVGFSERADVAIEPRISEQWFLRYPKTTEALEVVKQKIISFFPSYWEKVYEHWIKNIQDWCISRQVWWGHPIPVWWKNGSFVCQLESPGEGWKPDPDTLDTWFSSWLWAYETMDVETRKKFYPTDVLVTGPDIIFLWVARMVIAGLEFKPSQTEDLQQNIPFRKVYFTGLIRDKQGRKMSKSLGNSPDPIELINKYGADGLRFGLLRIAPQGQDIRFDESQIEEGRNFCNKLWNACRFRNRLGQTNPHPNPWIHPKSSFSHEILKKVGQTSSLLNEAFDCFEFNQAAITLYEFVWNEFCSKFIEAMKWELAFDCKETHLGAYETFDYTMSIILRWLHPFVPFVTEELWQKMGFGRSSIQFEKWPGEELQDILRKPLYDPVASSMASAIYEAAAAVRTLRSLYCPNLNQKVKFFIKKEKELTDLEKAVFSGLIGASSVLSIDVRPLVKTPAVLTPLGEIFLPLEGLINFELEKQRIDKELTRLKKDLLLLEKRLSDEQTLSKAPKEKIEDWKEEKNSLALKIKKLEEQRDFLNDRTNR
ncbi:valine--tRNA ligase [Candidatus Methylacidiphilum infernorum]|nr:valine--tRNA ligase [Candidatus Methylacidiphilum infernorum]